MQSADKVLDVIHKRGKEGKPLERVYRQLFNKDIYRLAYSRIYANTGAITRGIDGDTLDGMSESRIDRIIQKLRNETYRWKPVRRTYIPKPKGENRPLGIPSGEDKLLQAVLNILLQAYYEPKFSSRSHGFRPDRGCHTALRQIDILHQSASWFIEGDIEGCFNNIDHDILMEVLTENINDGRFLRLIRNLLKAGYVEDWKWQRTVSGTPQGGIISPLLSNIYMNKLDEWAEAELMPQWNFGHKEKSRRKINPLYTSYSNKRQYAKRIGDKETYKHYGKLMKTIPSISDDEGYRKLEYIRYADDFLLSFIGSKDEAKKIKGQISEFLKGKLKLKLSDEKTLITHASSGKARFLGYELRVRRDNERRRANGTIWFGVPKEVVREATKKYCKRGKPESRNDLVENSEYDIITTFQSEYRGFVQYYIMAHNLSKALSRLHWATQTSMLKTLARKLKSTTKKVAKKYKATKEVNGFEYKVIEVKVDREGKKPLTAHFGAIPLKRDPKPSNINDNIQRRFSSRSEIIQRMLKDKCEMCKGMGQIQVHHVRALKDLEKPGRKTKPAWSKRMSALRRKTLMVCITCHRAIHAGQHRKEWDKNEDKLESRMQ